MGKDRSAPKYPPARLIAFALLCISVFFTLHLMQAQVGRGPKTSAPAPTPTPERSSSTPAESSTQTGEKSKAQTRVVLIVTKDVASPSLSIETRIAVDGLVERLSLSGDVKVQAVTKDVSRGEAMAQAKAEHDAYLVWLSTEVDAPDSETASIATINPGCVFITYVVYSPQTGKVKTRGRAYQQDYVPQRCVASASNPAPAPSETRPFQLPYEGRLRRAGHEVANRVLRAFNLRVPTTDP
jgi:hypothetical protein